MSFFNPAGMSWTQAKARVAAVGGSQADSDMQIMAGYALEEAIRAWELQRDWKYTLIPLRYEIAGTWSSDGLYFTPTTSGVMPAAYLMVAVGAGSSLGAPGNRIIGGGGEILEFASWDGATKWTTNAAPDYPANGAGMIYTDGYTIASGQPGVLKLPTMFKKVYDLRLRSNYRKLEHVSRRLYDTFAANQGVAGVPYGYLVEGVTTDSGVTSANYSASIRLIPTPSIDDVVEMRWYRRHWIPTQITTGSADADAEVVDIPSLYFPAIVAAARVLFLANRGGEDSRMAFWMQKAEELRRLAVAMDESQPDESMGFTPAGPTYYHPNDITPFIEDS